MADIQSSNFLKIIFSFLNIKRKLKIVKYNNTFKNKIDLTFIHYNVFSKRYIKYESNKKGKEFNQNNKLVYEGEFLNGEAHEKGKEFFVGYNQIYFEGDYLNEGRWKGNEYNLEGELVFEGEYLKGERWKGKV